MKEIVIDQYKIPIKIDTRNIRSISISINETGHLLVKTKNKQLTDFEKEFILSKRTWILKYWLIWRERHASLSEFQEQLQDQTQLFGKPHALEFKTNLEHPKYYKVELNRSEQKVIIYQPSNSEPVEQKLLIKFALKEIAKFEIPILLRSWSEKMNLYYNRITIKDHKTKWGSCSQKKNININWHLMMLEQKAIDYVLVHELAHLREMNHGPKFWNIVYRYIPRYKEIIQYIKDNQWLIGIYD